MQARQAARRDKAYSFQQGSGVSHILDNTEESNKMKLRGRYFKKALSAVLVAAMLVGSIAAVPVSAKTQSSAKGDMLFFYATDKNGKDVLVKALTYDELSSLSHGQSDGSSYMYSTTDNYPTTQYCEGKGFTIPELVKYVSGASSVSGADGMTYEGKDSMSFMATDSYGNYNRTWTAEELYGQKRYYFEGLYGSNGWNTGWECSSEDTSKFGMTLDEYNSKYAVSDAYYNAKRAVFDAGVEMQPIMATESYSGRTSTETLVNSTEPGLAGYINANGGKVSGCLSNVLSDAYSLRLCVPMTEADLMSGHRTSYDTFKWVYNVRLKDASPSVVSAGTVPAPTASFSVSGDTLNITMSCADSKADIYYSFDGSPQIKYTGAVSYDIKGRDITSSPVTVYMRAVREGYDDAGVVTAKYPQSGVTFQTLYSEQTGKDIVFTAESSVSAADWNSWAGSIIGISAKKPQSNEYAGLRSSDYSVNNSAKTITFNKDIFDTAGAYSFIIYSKGFSNKNLSVSVKKAAPALTGGSYPAGQAMTITFNDSEYQNGLYIYAAKSGTENSVLIPATYLDRTQAGKVIIKKEYFDSQTCALKDAGKYTLEFTNNSFTPVSQKMEITITDAGATTPPSDGTTSFTDVSAGAWYADAVKYAVDNGLFSGTSATTFSPSKSMTRGMLVTVLWRMEGTPEPASQAGFKDVASGAYYDKAVSWAAANGIVSGLSADSFGPGRDITREQLAAILMRYAKFKGADVAASGDISAFRDSGSVASYATDAVKWAVGNGYIGGVTSDTIAPKAGATRAQVAAILMRYSKKQ